MAVDSTQDILIEAAMTKISFIHLCCRTNCFCNSATHLNCNDALLADSKTVPKKNEFEYLRLHCHCLLKILSFIVLYSKINIFNYSYIHMSILNSFII